MSLQLIIGRAGSGKSRYMLEQIRERLQEEPMGPPIIILVPEQATFQLERAIASFSGLKGTVRVQVLGFKRLAYRIMQETGGSALIPISDEGKKMLLYRIMRRLQDDLKLYGSAGGPLGLIDKLNSLYTETKKYGADSASLQQHFRLLESSGKESPLLKNKLHDLQLLFGEFEKELSGLYIDSEDHVRKLAEGASSSAYLQGSEIWVDGFHSFTPVEYEALGRLMEASVRVNVALTLDRPYDDSRPPNELNMFYTPAVTYMKLQTLAESAGMAVWPVKIMDERPFPRFKNSETLGLLESIYGTRRKVREGDQPGDLAQSLRLRAAVGKRSEVEAAVREMVRLAREEQVRWRDMALYVRTLDEYADLIEPICGDYGVPVFIDRRKSMAAHPLIELVRGALDVVKRFWKAQDVLRCVKTDFLLPLEGSLSREDMDVLENYVLASGIEGARWNSDKAWRGKPNLSLEPGETGGAEPAGQQEGSEQENMQLEKPVSAVQRAQEEEMERIRQARDAVVGPLSSFEKRMKRSKTAREMCEAVFALLEQVSVAERLDLLAEEAAAAGEPQRAMEHRSVWGAVLDLLDQIVDMMGEEGLDIGLFSGVLDTGLRNLKLGLVPPSLDQVLVGSADRTRSVHVKHVFMLGVNEGVMPALYQEEGILTDQERSRLAETGLVLEPGTARKLLDERFMIYQILSSAESSLWISYPAADEEGKALLPSEVIRDLRKKFSLEEKWVEAVPAAASPVDVQLTYVARPEPALSALVGQLRQWRAGAEISPVWYGAMAWFGRTRDFHHKLNYLLQSLDYRNGTRTLTEETSRRLYGTRLRTSVSRMERFAACPFSHFASHGLKLKERQLYRLKAPDIGQLFHAALSAMALSFKDSNRSWASLTPEECVREAEAAVDKLAPQLQGEILLSSKRYGFITRKLKNIVGRASLILGEQAKRGSFEPVGLELDFGPGKELPPLTFELENGCVMEIVGRVDRVDMAESEQGILLRVIDYKSSQTDLKLHEVYYGLALQMLTYLDVVLSSSEEWLGSPAKPAGTLYFHVHNPLLQSSNGMSPEQARQEMLKRFKLRGLVTADRDIALMMDNKLEKGHSDILPVAVKADGGFYSSAAVATPEQWDVLLSSVRRTIRGIGTRITEGDVAIEPYRLGQETACTFCAFKSVCQIEPSDESRYKLLAKPGKDRIWSTLEEESPWNP
ncbi:helicase-exonuclease AddAB subunit AddB [Paenibacillus physcomitrellae]|uniref:ATP-dependent helicase/deoxyribonuclease subunit B n=1 Tax=Paenibacillus physcomitrellae TaxID=1619311 RepID=A0ABQ1FKS3_9BACL|nr:helicase-exonuclease AddAB subunit AddB [Paenibacillus physcomitrellae]GGA20412.1 ATP-dependent helicase/deoxyribonuclease subunit B [Paenibacillus physcomitrellae]